MPMIRTLRRINIIPIGTVFDAPDEQARDWVARGGAEYVAEEVPAAPVTAQVQRTKTPAAGTRRK